MTPLHLAAESGRIKVLRFLVDKGADVNDQDDNGVTTSIYTNTNAGRSRLSWLYMCYIQC